MFVVLSSGNLQSKLFGMYTTRCLFVGLSCDDRYVVLFVFITGALVCDVSLRIPGRVCMNYVMLFSLFRSGHRVVILDVPLLFESHLHHLCQTTIVIDSDREVQIKRLQERGINAARCHVSCHVARYSCRKCTDDARHKCPVPACTRTMSIR